MQNSLTDPLSLSIDSPSQSSDTQAELNISSIETETPVTLSTVQPRQLWPSQGKGDSQIKTMRERAGCRIRKMQEICRNNLWMYLS